MATIQKLKDTYRVQIRRKGKCISACFKDLDIAKLWADYREDILDELKEFEPPSHELITLKVAIELKYRDMETKNMDKKTMQDILNIEKWFPTISSLQLGKINITTLEPIYQSMFGQIVRKGGRGDLNSGKKTIQTPATIFRKLTYLSTVFNFVIDKGVDVKNPVIPFLNQLRMMMKNDSTTKKQLEGVEND
jgi:hypothetical protein